MRLVPHIREAEPWPLREDGDGWLPTLTLAQAIGEVADQTAADAGSDLLAEGTEEERDMLRDRITVEMGAALTETGDRYRAPDGVLYTLEEDADE